MLIPWARALAGAPWSVWCKAEPGGSRCGCVGEFEFWFSLRLTLWRTPVGAGPLLNCGGLMTLPKSHATAISSFLFYEEIRIIV